MGKVTRLTGGRRGEELSQRLHLHEIPAEAEPPPASVGQDLRAARTRRGDELGQISHALRIRKDYLEALESDWADKLPGRTYAIGFVRSYASYLGLDAPSLVSRYKLAIAGIPESAPQVGPPPEPGVSHSGAGWTLAALVVAALLVYGVYRLAQPPIPEAGDGSSGTPTSSHAPPTRDVRATTPARSRPSLAAAPPPAAAPAPAAPTGEIFGAQNRNARVVLHAHAVARVLVEGPDGKVYINRVLHPGDVYRVPNLVGLSLTTADGAAVTLELDGRDAGAAGSPGHITEALPLDPPAIVERTGAGTSGRADKVAP